MQLTPAGRVAVRKAEHGMESVEDEVFGALSEEERATLRGLLAKTLEGMPSVAESAPAGFRSGIERSPYLRSRPFRSTPFQPFGQLIRPDDVLTVKTSHA